MDGHRPGFRCLVRKRIKKKRRRRRASTPWACAGRQGDGKCRTSLAARGTSRMSTNYARRSGNLAILASLLAVPLLLSASSATFAQDAGPPQAAAGPSNCGQRGGGGGLEEVCVTA